MKAQSIKAWHGTAKKLQKKKSCLFVHTLNFISALDLAVVGICMYVCAVCYYVIWILEAG